MKERLRVLAAERNLDYFKNNNWMNEYIAEIEFSYNVTKNRATGFSPFEMIFGNLARLPIDNLWSKPWSELVEKAQKKPHSDELQSLNAEHRAFMRKCRREDKELFPKESPLKRRMIRNGSLITILTEKNH